MERQFASDCLKHQRFANPVAAAGIVAPAVVDNLGSVNKRHRWACAAAVPLPPLVHLEAQGLPAVGEYKLAAFELPEPDLQNHACLVEGVEEMD
jgi:hypothetical protein